MTEWTNDFFENVRISDGRTKEENNVVPITSANGSDKGRYRKLLQRECDTVATTVTGRNDQFNKSAFDMAKFVAAGHLTREEVEDALIESGRQASRLGDHPFTDEEMRATLKSALDSVKVTPKTLNGYAPNVIEVDPETLSPLAENEQESQDHFAKVVRQRALQIRIDDEARELYNDWRASALGQEVPDIINLRDFLAIPDEDAQYRINDLWPTGGNVLLAAQYKAGKTSMIANLLRALADGQPFLGKFSSSESTRITLFDDELDERMLRRWLRDQGIHNTERIELASMKGRLSTFNILNARTRASWAERLRGSEVLILDCLRPCLDALGLDEHRDAGRFLTAWDALKKEAQISESIIVHHMGHGQERSRGDSRLLDWPDVNWKILKESQTESEQEETSYGRRFFSALGRDVNVKEGMLQWGPEGRTLTYIEGGRGEAKAVDAIDIIRAILREPENSEGLGTVALTRKLHDEGVGKTIARKAIQRAKEASVLIETEGARNAKILTLNPSEA